MASLGTYGGSRQTIYEEDLVATMIGILGAAGIAPAVVLRPALRRDDVVVAAVASRRGARGYADRFAIERAYDFYEELLADPDLDLVYNALPPSHHARWSIAALERGLHVLCEKPFSITPPRRSGSSRRRSGPGSGPSRRSTTITTR